MNVHKLSEANCKNSKVDGEKDFLEEMLKLVMHLRVRTAKMTQEAVLTHQPELVQKLEIFRNASDTADLSAVFEKEKDGKILPYEEIKRRSEDYNFEE